MPATWKKSCFVSLLHLHFRLLYEKGIDWLVSWGLMAFVSCCSCEHAKKEKEVRKCTHDGSKGGKED